MWCEVIRCITLLSNNAQKDERLITDALLTRTPFSLLRNINMELFSANKLKMSFFFAVHKKGWLFFAMNKMQWHQEKNMQ